MVALEATDLVLEVSSIDDGISSICGLLKWKTRTCQEKFDDFEGLLKYLYKMFSLPDGFSDNHTR